MRNIKTLTLAVIFIISTFSVNVFAEMKIATINVDAVFDRYQKTIELNERLEDEIQGKQSERNGMVEEIRKLKDELVLVADESRDAKQAEVDALIQKLQDYDEANRQKLLEIRNEYMEDILVELDEKVQAYGEKMGFDFILNGRLVLFGKDTYDVTEDILSEVNNEYIHGKK